MIPGSSIFHLHGNRFGCGAFTFHFRHLEWEVSLLSQLWRGKTAHEFTEYLFSPSSIGTGLCSDAGMKARACTILGGRWRHHALHTNALLSTSSGPGGEACFDIPILRLPHGDCHLHCIIFFFPSQGIQKFLNSCHWCLMKTNRNWLSCRKQRT